MLSGLLYEFLTEHSKWDALAISKLKEGKAKLNLDHCKILLRKAVQLNRCDIVKELLDFISLDQKNAKELRASCINDKNNDGDSALMLAAAYGHVECFELLLESGSVYRVNKKNKSALVLAAERNQQQILKLYFSKPRKLNYYDEFGNSLFENLLTNNQLDLAKQLIKLGLNINLSLKCPDNEFWQINNVPHRDLPVTPLYRAILAGNNALAKKMLAVGADPNVVSEAGEFPLFCAIRGNQEMLDPLLENRANPNCKNEGGFYPLFFLIDKIAGLLRGPNTLVEGGVWDNLQKLLDRGADPLQSSKQRPSFLFTLIKHFAVFKVETNAITHPNDLQFLYNKLEMIIKYCKDIDRIDEFANITILALSSYYGLHELCNLLVQQKANPSGLALEPCNFSLEIENLQKLWHEEEWRDYSEAVDVAIAYGRAVLPKPNFANEPEGLQLCKKLAENSKIGHSLFFMKVKSLLVNAIFNATPPNFPLPLVNITADYAISTTEKISQTRILNETALKYRR
jgi:ankyrin repeat protein